MPAYDERLTRFRFHAGSGVTRSGKSSCNRAVFNQIADDLQATISRACQVERLATPKWLFGVVGHHPDQGLLPPPRAANRQSDLFSELGK